MVYVVHMVEQIREEMREPQELDSTGRITTKGGRDKAFRIRARRRARTKQGYWHVGISTSSMFWLDLETPNISEAVEVAEAIASHIDAPVSVYPTVKSFWLVSTKHLDPLVWKLIYELVGMAFKEYVCEAFVQCCIRYGKATLRIDRKRGAGPKARILEVLPDGSLTFDVRGISP